MDFNLLNTPQAATALWILISIWSVFWKGIALWHSASQKQRTWFITLLIINIFGLLEIIYLFKFAKKPYTPQTFIAAVKTFSLR